VRYRTSERAAEVSHLFGSGWDSLLRQRGTTFLTAPFFTPEEERFVFPNRAIEIEAEVFIFQRAFVNQLALRIFRGIGIEKSICGIQRSITQKIKTSAVKIVTAAFCDQVDDSALRLALLRTKAVTLDAKLCDRVDRGKHQQGGV